MRLDVLRPSGAVILPVAPVFKYGRLRVPVAQQAFAAALEYGLA